MTLPALDTSNVPAWLWDDDPLAGLWDDDPLAGLWSGPLDERWSGPLDAALELGSGECVTFAARALARVAGDGLGAGDGFVVLAAGSISAFTGVPPSCWACASSKPWAMSLTAIMLPLVAVTAPRSQAPRPTRNRELTGRSLRRTG